MRRPPSSLRIGNFRLFFAGQVVSNTGTWFQNLTLSLIVLEETGRASALALVTVCQFTPLLLVGMYAGTLADRRDVRRILLATSLASAVAVAGLAWVVSRDPLRLPLVLGLVAVLGAAQAFERVAAQAFVYELVGPERLANGVALNTVAVSSARSVGPALAGVAYGAAGGVACLLVNTASYLVIAGCLARIDRTALTSRRGDGAAPPGLRAALREIRGNRPLVAVLAVNTAVTVGALNLMVVITAMVSLTLGGDAEVLGAAHALNAVGAVAGGLAVSSRRQVGLTALGVSCAGYGCALAVNAAAPSVTLFLLAAPLLGLGLGAYQGAVNGAAQSLAPAVLLGRVTALLTLGSVGTAPVGALLVGALVDASSARVAMGVGAVVCALCAVALVLVRRSVAAGVPVGPGAVAADRAGA
ncbi:MFS transporter [Geodermatophilus nigrescens]|uniref:Transmembrane secretion effector n=1 Tax=Geodermatophilus nigrescens TaxID=1070870 RepID=A0A1M5HIV1_9ACTN|nr:MFS transporter [Geodermatophilus nigrescens]SHG15857.1 Transmembrane secretion effector [Geodermatophilus nigrescens]